MNKLDWSKNLRGVYKKWIWGDTYNYSRICDYIQKINYCIQDLNNEIEALAEPTMKEVVYVIVLVDWICEAIEAIQKTLLCEVANNYTPITTHIKRKNPSKRRYVFLKQYVRLL